MSISRITEDKEGISGQTDPDLLGILSTGSLVYSGSPRVSLLMGQVGGWVRGSLLIQRSVCDLLRRHGRINKWASLFHTYSVLPLIPHHNCFKATLPFCALLKLLRMPSETRAF